MNLFIDFQKVCNSIWREGLKYALQSLDINEKSFLIVESMYASTKVSLSYKDNVSKSLKATVSLKQGDIVNTMFFDI